MFPPPRHPRLLVIPAEAGIQSLRGPHWIPAFAGMTAGVLIAFFSVIPAEAGIQSLRGPHWIPAFAGMTAGVLDPRLRGVDGRCVGSPPSRG